MPNAFYDNDRDEFIKDDGSVFTPVEELDDIEYNDDIDDIEGDPFFEFNEDFKPEATGEDIGFESWSPLVYTRPVYENTLGGAVTRFAADFMKFSRGYKSQEAMKFASWQRWLVDSVLEVDGFGLLRYRRVVVGLPRKNGKSLLGTAIALERVAFGQAGENIYSCATSKEQARLVFDEAKKQIGKDPVLRSLLEVQRDRILNRVTGNFYKVLASDSATAQGLGPSLVIFDELHALKTGKSEELWAAMTEGSADRAEAIVIAITTAGGSKDSLLGKLYDYGAAVARGDVDDPRFGLFWWGASEDADIYDPQVWKKCNPNLALGLMDTLDFESSLSLGAMDDALLSSFMRYRLNMWVRTDGAFSWLYPEQIERVLTEGKIEHGAKIAVGFDGSLSNDSTAVVGIELQTGTIEVLGLWESKGVEGWTVPREEVLLRVEEVFEKYDVAKMFCDDSYFETDVQMWITTYPKNVVQIIPQSVKRMKAYAAHLKYSILKQEVKISKNSKLQTHLTNAVLRANGTVAKESSQSEKKIDAAIAAILANAGRTELEAAANAPAKKRRAYRPSSYGASGW